eukprot:TRINITY_DN2592_c0_g1_i1.p3 TRINITY_DN2592_c0_g1~~TRINITY_DN2592_c0_g1_i1.p3  ORF type:complete len:167 (+),score=40.11 TRINITY_DN2592_c0_g1_i1:367-867(+)
MASRGLPTWASAVAVAVAAATLAAFQVEARDARPTNASCVGDIKAVTFRLAPLARTPNGVYVAGTVPDDAGLPPFLRGAALNLTAQRRHWYSAATLVGGDGSGGGGGGGGGGPVVRATEDHWWSMRRLRHRHRPSFRISVSAPFVAGAGAGRGRAHLVVTPAGRRC